MREQLKEAEKEEKRPFLRLRLTDTPRSHERQTHRPFQDCASIFKRTFRNHFEHFDERLETWYQQVGSKSFADSCIGATTSEFGGLSSAHYLRNFATNTQSVWFRGDSYELIPITTEVKALFDRLSRELDNMRPW